MTLLGISTTGYVLLGVLAAVLLLLAVLVVRAFLFRPHGMRCKAAYSFEQDPMHAGESLAKMVSFKTVSHPDRNEDDEAEFEAFRAYLKDRYPNVHKNCSLELVDGRNLVYHLKGKKQEHPAILMAHYDVVPASGQNWSFDPFCGEIKDGVILGRGTLDTKGSLCGVLEGLEARLTEGYVPEDDLYLCFGGDEEVGGPTTVKVVEMLASRGVVNAKLVLDEGGAIVDKMFPGVTLPIAVVGVAEKGMTNVRLRVRANGGHASTPTKKNPATRLARAIVNVEKHQMKTEINAPTKEMLRILGSHSTFAMRLVFANMWLFKGLVKKLFSVMGGETNAMLRTTFAFTQLKGSDAQNVLPALAEANINVRIAINHTTEDVVNHLKKVIKDNGVEVTPLVNSAPSEVTETRNIEYRIVKRTIEESFGDVIVSPYVMLAASDSRHFCKISDCVLRFSPFAMSKEERALIHAADERIPVEKVAACAEFYYRLLERL